MRTMVRFGMLVVGLAVVASWSLVSFAADAKYTISDVMKEAMKGGLCKKVAGGGATPEEKKKLLEMFEALAANKPPKGSEAAWKAKTGALVEAVKKDDGKALAKAAACGPCHMAHR